LSNAATCADEAAWSENLRCRIQGSAATPNDGFLTLVTINVGVDDAKTAARKAKAAQTYNNILQGLTGVYLRLTSKYRQV